MKLLQKWSRQEPEREKATDNYQHSSVGSSVDPKHEKGGEYDEDASLNWLGNDQDYSGIPDSLRGTDDEKSSTDTVTVRTLAITEDSSYTVEGDIEDDTTPMKSPSPCDDFALTTEKDADFDPYDTGSLKVTRQ